jgi:hypothetical protein
MAFMLLTILRFDRDELIAWAGEFKRSERQADRPSPRVRIASPRR